MLATLDTVDWASLTHAYGTAADVPDLIRALRTPEWEDALHALYGNIYHQGTTYEATGPAVPFLLEVLAAPDTPCRDHLCGLLAHISIGFDEAHLPSGVPVAALRAQAAGGAEILAAKGNEDIDDFLGELPEAEANRAWAHVTVRAYDAVAAGLAVVASLLTDDDLRARAVAAYTLGWFPDEGRAHVGELLVAAAHPDAGLAATAIVALGLLGGPVPGAALTDERDLVRWSAATALGRLHGPDASAEAVAELTRWATGDQAADERMPYLDGDLRGYAALTLEHAVGPAAFTDLLTALGKSSGAEALNVAGAVLRQAFPDGPVPDGTPLAGLTGRQRDVVRVLASSPRAWLIGTSSFGNFRALVRDYGLPDDYEKMRAHLG